MKTRTLVIIISALLIYLLIGALSGCKTKTVTEYVAVHDTLCTHSIDTVTKIVTKMVTQTDSAARYHFLGLTEKLLETRDRTITLNDRGDTTRVDTYTATMHYLHEKDSTGYYHTRCDSLSLIVDLYKSRCDSLQSVIDRQHEKVVVKKESWWHRWKLQLITIASIVIVLLVLLGKNKATIKKWLKR